MNGKSTKIKQDIKTYEDKYQMSSNQFYELFCDSKLDDREDFMAWAGLWEMLHPFIGKPVIYRGPFDGAEVDDWESAK